MLPVRSRGEWVDHARKVENLGYSTLWQGQHPAWGGLEPTVALMAAAAATTTLRVASHVFTNDFHHPVLLAQAATSLDVLSDGRFEFGVGAGWLPADYETCGLPFDEPAKRVARLEEAVRVIKGLWAHGPDPFMGNYYRATSPHPPLAPKQQPYPPIFLGGGGRRMLTLAAREADIIGLGGDPATATPEATTQRMAWIRQAAGTRFAELEIHVVVDRVHVTGDRPGAAQEVAQAFAGVASHLKVPTAPPTAEHILSSPKFLVGTVDEIVEELQVRRERYGISYVAVHGDQVDAFGPVVARLAGT
jgi:probable F420-dependent oxidoreductase